MWRIAAAMMAVTWLAGSAEAASTVIPIVSGNSIDLKFRVDRPDAQFLAKFSYDLTLRLDFGSYDPFAHGGDYSGIQAVQTGQVVDGGFGIGDADYFNSLLSGYSTTAPVQWHYEYGRIWMGNRPILQTEWGPDVEVYQENAFGMVLDLFFEPDRTVYVLPYVVAFRDRLFNDHGAINEEIRITNLNLPIVSPPVSPVSPVPEPASWAMMIAGFGMIGAIMRRPRRYRVSAL